MLTDTFYWVLNMSITATLTGLIVLIIRKIRHIPRAAIYVLWLLPLIRFVLPFSFGYKYSLMNLLDGIAVKTVPLTEGTTPQLTAINSVRAAESYFPVEYKTNTLKNVFSVASSVWIIIALSAIMTLIALYQITKSEIKNAKHLKENIYISDKLLSPVVFGIFKPKIILPEFMKKERTEYILKHEKAHIKRLDNLWRVVAVITCCIHWFNPFVWLYLKKFLEDMELSCDESILRKCNDAQKVEYAKALIECESKKAFFYSAFGGAKTKVRIEKILSYKKLTCFSTICLILLLTAIAVTLLTNASVY